MPHISPDFKTKKDFKEALRQGMEITLYNPSGLFPIKPNIEVVEAPAEYHKWYARVTHNDGIITKVLS